jgi:2-polyprenyl-3-methyl-5-hydroxy-6-metoxy-1,4-benzoquinol methylase
MLKIDYSNLSEISCPICSQQKYTIVTTRFDSGRLVQCSECNHVYLNPTLPDHILTQIYQEYHATDDDQYLLEIIDAWFKDVNGPYQHAFNYVQKAGGFLGKSVLEVGSGPGRFLHECQKQGACVTGIDPSPTAVRLAKEYFNLDLFPNMLEQARQEQYLSPSGFDLVFAFEVIEHVTKPCEFVQNLFDLLVPGGLLFISTPNFHLFSLMGSAAPVVSQWQEHLHFFDTQSLAQCIERANFQVMETTTINSLTSSNRHKQILSNNSLIKMYWEKIRKIKFVYSLKNAMYTLLERYQDTADLQSLNGTCIICIAQKPIDKSRQFR